MTRKSYPSDKADQYIVRFPDGLRDRLKDEAAKNNRSMNAEIVARLEESFAEKSVSKDEILSEIKSLKKEMRSAEMFSRVVTIALHDAAKGDNKMLHGLVDYAVRKPVPEGDLDKVRAGLDLMLREDDETRD